MTLKEALEKRYSARKFTDESIPVDVLKELVRRAGLAPSVNNSQPWKFLVVRNKEKITEISNLVRNKIEDTFLAHPQNVQKTVEYFSTIFENAPAVIFVASESYSAIADDGTEEFHEKLNKDRRFPDIQSIGAAVENLLLSAVDLGYGACWLSGMMIASAEIEDYLEVHSPLQLVTAVAVGKPPGTPIMREKISLGEIFQLVD